MIVKEIPKIQDHHFQFIAHPLDRDDDDVVRLEHTIKNEFSVLTNFTIEMTRERIVPFENLKESVQTIVKWLFAVHYPNYNTYSYLEFTPEEVKNLFIKYKNICIK